MQAILLRNVLALLFIVMIGPTVFAQTPLRTTYFDVAAAARQPVAQRPVGEPQMILGGLLGGAVGFFGGGFAGALINAGEENEEDFLQALTGFAVGAVIGETIMLPLGVHIANRRQGNYGLSLLAASAITGVGLVFATSGEDHLEYLIPVPVFQLLSSIIIEKRTTK